MFKVHFAPRIVIDHCTSNMESFHCTFYFSGYKNNNFAEHVPKWDIFSKAIVGLFEEEKKIVSLHHNLWRGF